jgi:hypothetical protein
MTSVKLLGAALIVAAIVAPASAQQAISEPGAYSFYHPNNDVLNGGAPTPESGMAAPSINSNAMAQMQMVVKPHRARHAAMKH